MKRAFRRISATWPAFLACAALLAVLLPAHPASAEQEAFAGWLTVPPDETYLASQNGYFADVPEAVGNAVPIDLAADLGVHPGDEIKLVRSGDFSTHGNPIFENQIGIREHDEMIGVFARSSRLSNTCRMAQPPNQDGIPFNPACWGNIAYNRVTDAIQFFDPNAAWRFPTVDHGTGGALRTDIPQDFLITGSTRLTVPAGATHLFVAAHDDGRGANGVDFGSWYYDNHDVGEDFTLTVYKLLPDPPPPPPPPDEVSISIDTYSNAGPLQSGNFTATTRVIRGTGEIAGLDGGTATVSVVLNRFLGLPIYLGTVSVRDEGANMARRVQLWFVQVSRDGSTWRTRGSYLDFSRFPPRSGPISLAVTDNG